jgi:hypothetical protein
MSRTVRLLVTIDLDDDDHRAADEVRADVERQLAGDLADVALIAATDDDGIPPSPDPAIIERDARTAKALTDYLAAVMRAMMRNDPRLAPYLSPICPECGQLAGAEDGMHIVLGAVVVVGCEGYWVINPNVVGIASPNWQPQP